jgi:hypothetical protein
MDEDNNTEDTPAQKPDDGTLQDLKVSLRFHVNYNMELCQQRVLQRVGKEITLEEAKLLQEVYLPFDSESPEEMEKGMTQDEYEVARADFIATIKELRPTLLRLFDLDEETAEYQVCDLGDPSTEKIDPLDAFLVAAFRFSVRM